MGGMFTINLMGGKHDIAILTLFHSLPFVTWDERMGCSDLRHKLEGLPSGHVWEIGMETHRKTIGKP